MTGESSRAPWLVAVIRLPTNPSRHRVGVWRELRRVGAIPLGGGVWALPGAAVFAAGLEKVTELVGRADGQVLTLESRPRGVADETALLAEFNAARAAEWTEFASECGNFRAEIAKERRKGKFTVAELDEEEQNLDRLRRWYRELRARDIFTVPQGAEADEQLKACAELLDEYADEVYRAVHAPLGTEDN
jgi:flagellar motility protein MotE (MotC chaperone)